MASWPVGAKSFPQWIPRLGGRTVLVLPASVVTVALPPAAFMMVNVKSNGGFEWSDWGVWLPGVLQLGWAAGLGIATWAYYVRRPVACRVCERGELR